MEIGGLVAPKSDEAKRICEQDINEVLAAFVQDRQTVERGVFDEESPAEEFTQIRMGRIIADRYPDLTEEDREAVRQHAVAAIAMTQKAKENAPAHEPTDEPKANTAFIDGVRQYVTDVKDLEIDLIDRINPFQTARAILSKAMDEKTLKEVAEIIAKKRISLTHEEARMLAERAIRFKQEHGRLPSLTSNDAGSARWPKALPSCERPPSMSERTDRDILTALVVEPIRKSKTANTPREARIIAGFEGIQKFFEEHKRPPQHGEQRDIFERLYAVRLDRIRAQDECRELLKDLDRQGCSRQRQRARRRRLRKWTTTSCWLTSASRRRAARSPI